MAIKGTYYGLDEATLLQMRTDTLGALESLRTGKRFVSTSGSGKSFSKEHMTYAQLQAELGEIRAALQQLDPSTYGKRTRRLFSDYSQSNCGN